MDEVMKFPVRFFKAPLTANGFVQFINITPGITSPQGWICDRCFKRVTVANQRDHAENHR